MLGEGQRLGNYRLVRLLGQGSFAEVYLGEHVYLETQAAIKVLHTQLTREDTEQFRIEARTIARLEHPHIVRVLDFGVEGTTPFLVMSYAPNGTLRTRYPKGTRLPLATVVSYVKQIAPALQYAHEQRLVHRDIKPENLLVGRANEILLSDFGIALVAQSSRYQSTRDMAGTIAYMAPEQIEAHPRPASDQYSLGIVVYEWLSGDRPFHGSFTEIAIKHSLVPPPPLREKVPTLSPMVEQVVLQALVKDPQRRFASIQAFAIALEQASQAQESATLPAWPLPHQPIVNPLPVQQPSQAQEAVTLPARPLSHQPIVNPLQQGSQRQEAVTPPAWPHPAAEPMSSVSPVHGRRGLFTGKAMLLLGLALIFVVGSVAFFLSTSNKSSNALPAVNTQTTAQVHASTTPDFHATATAATNAYNVATANGIMLGFNAQHTRVNPYEQVLSPANVSLLVQAWKANTGGSIGSVPTVANGIVYINAREGNSDDGNLYAFNAETGKVLWSRHIGSYDFGCAPTVANGVVYMGGFDHKLYALDSKTGAVLWTALTGGRIGSSPVLVNGVIYLGSDDGTLYAFDAASGSKKWAYQIGSIIWSSPAVANAVVYVGSEDGNFYAIKADTGNLLWKVPTGNKIRSSPAIANGVVYVGSEDGRLYAFDAVSGTQLWSFLTGDKIDSSPAVANGVVYIGSEDGRLYALDAVSGT